MDKIEEILNSPEALGKVMDLAQNLMGSKEEPAPAPASDFLNGIDPALLQTLGTVMQELNRNDDRRFQFLNSLRPYMGDGSSAHIDKAVQIMRLSRAIRHLFNNLGGSANV